jgi:UDP-N-acetylmuramyl pentapeptide synthase
MDPACIFTPARADAAKLLSEIRRSGDVILVKASRGMRMEEIVAAAF